LSHLETLTLFHRALRRSNLPIRYTGGEHPHPKSAFSSALPVGVESLAEYMDLWFSRMPAEREVEEGLNAVLPEGISVLDARLIPLNAPSLERSIAWMEYELSFPEAAEARVPSPEDLKRMMEAFYDGPPAPRKASGKEGGNDRDFRRAVKLAEREDGRGLICRIHHLSGSTPSAMRVVKALFPSSGSNGLRPRILKTGVALLSPSPPVLASKRKANHDQ
jgi:radical SAM-linked protein